MSRLTQTTCTQMPQVGFGLWKIPVEEAADTVYAAIEAGYRHLDSASDYGNEAAVGLGIEKAIKAGLCRREELWITSKLWNTCHAPEHVGPALQRSLTDLRLDYLDLYSVHFPIALAYVPPETRYPPGWFFDPAASAPKMQFAQVPLHQTWAAMETQQSAGLTRHIGVCNYNSGLLQDLLAYALIKPHSLQIEVHPYNAQQRLLRFCQQHDIAVTAFSPLGALSYLELNMAQHSDSVLAQPVIRQIAENLQRTPAQIVLRWGIQRGTAVIPKTSKPERLRENLALFDFELSPQDMQAIEALDRKQRFNDPGVFCESAFNTLCPIYD
ncbi:MAG: aldo/keto reductase [Pseudomonadales bacterium]|nr:aldo/keto reductase [Pseudomonadales bacterium]